MNNKEINKTNNNIKSVKISSPATSANLGPGYDVFGLALSTPNDIITISTIEKLDEQIKITVSGEKSEEIPTEVDKNTGGVVAKKIMEDYNIADNIHIHIEKGIKPGSGLGSSSASCAGVAVAMNELFNLNLSKLDLVKYASLGEEVAAGAPHADNVAPAIYGGFTIVVNQNPLEILNIPCNFEVIVALPNIQISTKEARELVPKEIPIKYMINNVGNSCGMIYALYNNNSELFGKYLQNDVVVEPVRANLIDNYNEIKNKVKDMVYGITISGSGPGIIAIPKKENILEIEKIFKETWNCPVYYTKVGSGAFVLERK